jgi:hypothetical protein
MVTHFSHISLGGHVTSRDSKITDVTTLLQQYNPLTEIHVGVRNLLTDMSTFFLYRIPLSTINL